MIAIAAYSLHIFVTNVLICRFAWRRNWFGLLMMVSGLLLGGYLESLNLRAIANNAPFYVRYHPAILEKIQLFGAPLIIAIGWSGFVGICYFLVSRLAAAIGERGSWLSCVAASLFVPVFSLFAEGTMIYLKGWTWHHPANFSDAIALLIGTFSLIVVYWISVCIAWPLAELLSRLPDSSRDS